MKFFSKYKKQIFSVFLCVALFSCFIGFSFSSSADVVNEVTNLDVSSMYFFPESDAGIGSQFFVKNGNEWRFDVYLPYSEPTPLFECLYIGYDADYSIPSYNGRPLSLSFNVDFTVFNTGYLSYIPDDVNITYSAIFTGCYLLLYFKDGSVVSLTTDTFILKDDDIGEIVDPHSSEYWKSIKGDIMDLSIYALFDVSQYYDKVIDRTFICFPDSSPRTIYYSNDSTSTFLNIGNIVTTYDFAYTPFNDVVQDDLTDIKDSLSGVNNKLNSISDSVNHQFEQTNETLSNIDQGIQDILKPSAPAVDFKNQWNDYFANNPIPDFSALPNFDMSHMIFFLDQSSHIVQSIFSPFFLRNYSISIPALDGSGFVHLDPVKNYISISVGLSLGFILVRLLKGSRG